ncbi:amylo-alpha-1,6-glucosidase [Fimbriimonas ginsengisoli]|uniref:Putative glycogen debranching enzyme, archaeal type, TIGR01561 n=1 Tax=Fimbriimonas ginsengisoli Gsoil 348 TaxID=661478 RepID=A0A068NUC8_FIMGI|nr:amylo-alpha-1,6-glucosidase [Fimbriimonas ginsengisoli]AIE87118.1 Putative glycogen debranching enzyme, archaeal type, TIGR01561 [Fimbriimonas ginsengisoli Gsoil 348]
MRYSLDESKCRNLEVSTRREWVLTNGTGAYAMGTAGGINTRRYHGHLIAAITPPTGRMLLLAAVDALVQTDGNPMGISANQYPGAIYPEGFHYLRGFSVDDHACWRYRAGGAEVVKRLAIHPHENASTVVYENVGTIPFNLILRPLVCHRDHHGNFYENPHYPDDLEFLPSETQVKSGDVSLYLSHGNGERVAVQGWYYRFEHNRESDRGLADKEDLFCPCELRYYLKPGEKATIVAATRPSVEPLQISDEEALRDLRLSAMLRDAAERFFVKTHDRSTIIAGYPWFTDWGRDTMISIPGLCLHTGRVTEARQILSDFSTQLYHGLIPNRFVEVGERPDYNTVDATLWFGNAIYKTLMAEWDEVFATRMLPVLQEVYDWHVRGTEFGIHVDPFDGLLTQGEPGVQLTWMDAKVGDWVVTPRHGKPIEINGLWINLLRVLEWLSGRLGLDGTKYGTDAERAEESFNQRFWHEGRGHFLDTVDPTDASLRPNQLIAMALPFSPVQADRAQKALEVVARELLTPNGIRTLGPDEPGYRGAYSGSLPELDASYHQGTAWPWLLGPYVTALVRFTGDKQEAKRILRNSRTMLEEYGLGGIAEVYDGDEPQHPGGCPWQAWSVAEVLRAWVEDVSGD